MKPIIDYEEELLHMLSEEICDEVHQLIIRRFRLPEKNKKVHNWYYKI